MDVTLKNFGAGSWLLLPNPLSEKPLRYFIPEFLSGVQIIASGDGVVPELGEDTDLFWLPEAAHVNSSVNDSRLGAISGKSIRDALSRLQRSFSSPSDLGEVHATLMGRSGVSQYRSALTWIGGGADTESFLPPPSSALADLIEDYLSFLKRPDIPSGARQVLSYSQLIWIHPFDDGNGRLARLLAGFHQAGGAQTNEAALVMAGLAMRRLEMLQTDERIKSKSRPFESQFSYWTELRKWAREMSLQLGGEDVIAASIFQDVIGDACRNCAALYRFLRARPFRKEHEFDAKFPMSRKARERLLTKLKTSGYIEHSEKAQILFATELAARRCDILSKVRASCPSPGH